MQLQNPQAQDGPASRASVVKSVNTAGAVMVQSFPPQTHLPVISQAVPAAQATAPSTAAPSNGVPSGKAGSNGGSNGNQGNGNNSQNLKVKLSVPLPLP